MRELRHHGERGVHILQQRRQRRWHLRGTIQRRSLQESRAFGQSYHCLVSFLQPPSLHNHHGTCAALKPTNPRVYGVLLLAQGRGVLDHLYPCLSHPALGFPRSILYLYLAKGKTRTFPNRHRLVFMLRCVLDPRRSALAVLALVVLGGVLQ